MQNPEEDAVAGAARHVMAAEKHVAQQEILLAELVQGGHEEAYSVVPGSSPDDGSAAFEVRAPS
jgi:hypothetical protein